MSIFPLKQYEADLAEAEREAYERLKPPDSMVVRFGSMRLVGEFPYRGDAKPGCGSKIVVRTFRGTEVGEMLTSTCPNAGCSKSVTRKEMLEFIENSGGKDYPFYNQGKVLRVATIEDMNTQSALEGKKQAMRKGAQAGADRLGLGIKIVEAEPILGGERLTFYFTAEDRVDFRELVQELAAEHGTRIEMRQVGARDEARLVADYERCGQHCCCKQFLKVLKPVSIRSAKQQKATLDPLKISGRCGRLMCCLRYEDETYNKLYKRLPKMRKRVGTPYGVGVVVDRQVLTQLVLVQIEGGTERVAVPVEEIVPPEEVHTVLRKPEDPLRGMDAAEAGERSGAGKDAAQDRGRARSESEGQTKKKRRSRRGRRGKGGSRPEGEGGARPDTDPTGEATPKKKGRRRRGRRSSGGGGEASGGGESSGEAGGETGGGGPAKKKRRRRRRRGPGGEGGSGGERRGGPEDAGGG